MYNVSIVSKAYLSLIGNAASTVLYPVIPPLPKKGPLNVGIFNGFNAAFALAFIAFVALSSAIGDAKR